MYYTGTTCCVWFTSKFGIHSQKDHEIQNICMCFSYPGNSVSHVWPKCHAILCFFVFLKVLNFSSTFFLPVSKRRLLGIQDLDAAKSHNWAIKVQRMCGHSNGVFMESGCTVLATSLIFSRWHTSHICLMLLW